MIEKTCYQARYAELALGNAIVSVVMVFAWVCAYLARYELGLDYAVAFDGAGVGGLVALAALQVRMFFLRRKINAFDA